MPTVIIGSSNHNLHRFDAVNWSAKQYRDYLRQTEQAGFMWNHIRTMGGVASQLVQEGGIITLQQSWRSESMRKMAGLAMHADIKGVCQEAVLTVGLPNLRHSLGSLEKIQRAAGSSNRLPLEAHPNEQSLGNRPPRRNIDYPALNASGRFGPLICQWTAELLNRWHEQSNGGVSWGELTYDTASLIELGLAQQDKHGFGGAVLIRATP
ncbi:MAG TPA: hypothetical protein VMY99_02730 [Nevskiaceae bacterium]|nr:hypothetical protein [Nevskiaceae bacterium]